MEHLRLLAIFYYILGAMLLLCATLPLIHVGMGVAMLTGAFPVVGGTQGSGKEMELFIGAMFVAMGSVMIILGWALGIFTIYTGRCLQAGRRHTMCIVCSALLCTQFPFGTVLGIFTLIQLAKGEVKAEFTS